MSDNEDAAARASERRARSAPPPRSHIGTISLLAAVAGALASHVAYTIGPFAGATWLALLAAGFEAATVGALADWFAVTALFRHPLGIPIPHTAIIPTRRAKIIEGIVTMVEEDWLSPEVIGARLERVAPSALVRDWLADPERVRRLGAPLRGLLRRVARLLTEEEVVALVGRTIQRHLQDLPAGRTAGEWLSRALRGGRAEIPCDACGVALVRKPRAEPRGEVGAVEPPLDGLANEEVIANEAREGAADIVLARRHDGRVRNGEAQRPAKQRRHGEPVREPADQRSLGECSDGAEPRALGHEPPCRREQQRHRDEQRGREPAHAAQASFGFRVLERKPKRGLVHPNSAEISSWMAAAARYGSAASRIGRPTTM